MPTFQNSAGAGKAAKFVDANPLAPMADPFAGMVSHLFSKKNQKYLFFGTIDRLINRIVLLSFMTFYFLSSIIVNIDI